MTVVRVWTKRVTGALVAGAALAALAWFGWPRPIAVDLATVVVTP